MPRQDVAVMEAMEAMEDAGVIGSCAPGLRAFCHRKGEKTLYIYPLKVTTVLKMAGDGMAETRRAACQQSSEDDQRPGTL